MSHKVGFCSSSAGCKHCLTQDCLGGCDSMTNLKKKQKLHFGKKNQTKCQETALSLKIRFGYFTTVCSFLLSRLSFLVVVALNSFQITVGDDRHADFPSSGSCTPVHFQRGSDLQPRSVMCQTVLKPTEDSRRPTCCEKRLPPLWIFFYFFFGLFSSNFTFIRLQIPADN